jgi:cold-inducible RNA-binding protein
MSKFLSQNLVWCGNFFQFTWYQGEERKMNAKLYVGNLPYSANEEDLKTLFAQAGTVASVTLITDRASGRAKGFGFVEMGSQAEAEEAIRMFNEYDFGGRALKVSVARPPEERGNRPRRGGPGQQRGGYGDRGRDRNRRDDRY